MSAYEPTISVYYSKNSKTYVEQFRSFEEIFQKTDLHSSIHTVHATDMNLKELPKDIQLLTNMTSLNLSFNNLTILPEEICSLTKLKELFLFGNRLLTLPANFGRLAELTDLHLNDNSLSCLTPSFKELAKLRVLNLSVNKFVNIPREITELPELKTLMLNGNKLKVIGPIIGNFRSLEYFYAMNNRICSIPSEIGRIRTLKELNLEDNCIESLPDTIGDLGALIELNVSNNYYLSAIPRSIGRCASLVKFNAINNRLTRLPIEIVQCRRLTDIRTDGNEITIDPVIQRFIDGRHNVRNHVGLYNDGQNVHTSSIQASIKKTILNLLNDPFTLKRSELTTRILEDEAIETNRKQLIIGYINDDKETHSELYCTFQDIFMKVYGRIVGTQDAEKKKELYKRLQEELGEGECKCFTGRLSRLVNVLNGFYDDVEITISANEQISNVILVLRSKHGLKIDDDMTDEVKEKIRAELEERGYEDDIIEVWLNV